MDQGLAARLNENNAAYEPALFRRLSKLGRDYVTAGLGTLNYYLPDIDTCNDLLNCYAAGYKQDFEKRDRMTPDNFLHPMTATQIWTLATFISQILFGGETTRNVEPRKPEDEGKADIINELLAWNDNQQPTYNQGFFWILDALNANRGVMYDHWQEMLEVTLEPVEYELPYEPEIDPETGKKIRKPRNYEPKKATRFRKKRTRVGGFTKIENISPYDFICDPTMPIPRFQEGRFAGHRVLIPWLELKRRSELPPDDYLFVLPKTVERLKNSKGKKVTAIAIGATTSISRSYFERMRRGQPTTTMTGSDKVDREDGGVVECFVMQIRGKPKTYEIFPEDDEEELIEILQSGDNDLLSVNVMTNTHDQFPYAVGEGRPNAHMQFSPSWTLVVKGCQDYVDYLKNRRKESLARTSGNIFIGNPAYVDFEAFTDPKKDGLFIPITEAAAGKPIDQIITQVPIHDMTANFHAELREWQQTAEDTTGSHATVQGVTGDDEQTATQFAGTQQMAQGRISTLARLLSAGQLVPQTQRIISNLQQFLPDEMTIRIVGKGDSFDPDKPQDKFMQIIRDSSLWRDENGVPLPKTGDDGEPIMDADTGLPVPDERGLLPDIQGQFDVVPHDGSLPGTDAKKVAALSRGVEAWSTNPAFQNCFNPTIPGNIDPRKMFFKLLKATGFPIGDLAITREQAQKNLQEQNLAMGAGPGMPPQQPPPQITQDIPPPPLTDAGGGQTIPSAAQVPPNPTAAPPQVRPQNT